MPASLLISSVRSGPDFVPVRRLGSWAWLFCALLLGSWAPAAWAAAANPLLSEQFHVIGNIYATVALPNGQILIGGDFETVNGVRQPKLARLNADGSLDRSWQPKPTSTVLKLAVSGDEVYLAIDSSLRRILLSGDGSIDADWQGAFNQTAYSDQMEDIAVQGGFVYLLFSRNNLAYTNQQLVLVRYFRSGTGALDRFWTSKLLGTSQYTGSAQLAVDETHVYVRHSAFPGYTIPPTYIDRFPHAGRGNRDPHWRGVIRHPQGSSGGMALDAENVYVAGNSLQPSRTVTTPALRISKRTGKVDPQWGATELGDLVNTNYATYSNLRVAVGGGLAYFTSPGRVLGVKTGPENPTGTPAFSVSVPTTSYDEGTYGRPAPVLTNGMLYLAATPASASNERLQRVDSATGAIDPDFQPRIYREAAIYQVLRLPNRTTFVAGRFDAVGNVQVKNLARFEPDGTLNRAWKPVLNSAVPRKLFASGDSLYVASTYSDSFAFGSETSSYYLDKYSLAAPATLDRTWNPFARLNVGTPSTQSMSINLAEFGAEGLFVYASRYSNVTYNSVSSRLVKIPYAGDGTPDAVWGNKSLGGYTYRVHQGYLYILNYSEIIRLAATGSGLVDTSWKFAGNPATMAADPAFLYVAGRDGSVRRAALAGTGAAEPTWNVDTKRKQNGVAGGGEVRSMLKAGSFLYLSGRFDSVNGSKHLNLARLSETGAVDPSFPTSVPYLNYAEGFTNFSVGPRWVGAEGDNPILGGAFDRIDDVPAFPPTLFNSLAPPTLTRAGSRVFADVPNAEAAGIQFFQVTAILGGTLALSDGTPLATGAFITPAQGRAGLDFTPDPDYQGSRFITLVSAYSQEVEDIGGTASRLDLTDTVPPRNQYAMTATALTVREGTPSAVVSVQKIGPQPGGVTFQLEDGSARAGASYSMPGSLTVSFPAGDSVASIIVPLLDDLIFSGNKDFRVLLTGTTDNGLILSAADTRVTIIDDDPLGDTSSLVTRPALVAPPAGNATLMVTLNAPLGSWHLLGEAAWHASGVTLTGLTRGNYFVEFRPTNGFIAPPARTVPVDLAEHVSLTGDYLPLESTAFGALSVSLEPASVANAAGAARGQWQIVGETGWRESGATAEDLPTGSYDIVFKPVPGRKTPPLQSVTVAGSILYTVTGTYLIADTTTGETPEPVDFATLQTSPYAFVGQIRTPVGFASGTAVRSRVVLTVAHALFDDVALSAVTDARWYHQKARGDLEPPPQGARGWYIFEGYAGQRTADLASGAGGVGLSTPESQKLDVAAMWFLEPCARGTFAGYLKTDADNDWLLAARHRILAGYPVDEVAEGLRGVLHATDPDVASTFTALNPVIRATDSLRGSGGMSGGPLFVEEAGEFYPAGVFLGGTAQCLIRVIDEQVVDLINRGEISGNGGDNNDGGGITLVSPGVTSSPYAPTVLSCTLSPAGALSSGAGWRIVGEQAYRASSVRIAKPPGTYRLEFKPVAGFATPDSKVLTLVQGQVATARVAYVPGARVTTIIEPVGAGTAPGRDFPLGQRAALTAKPAPSYLFSAWMKNGEVVSRTATYSFDMTGPLTLTAVFKPGSFFPYLGNYAGLHETEGVADGLATFSLTGTGALTGKVTYGGKTYAIKGQLNEDGIYSGPLGNASLLLSLDRTSPVGVLTGEIFDGGTPTRITATQAPFDSTKVTDLAGMYTVLLPAADPADASHPPGSGYASLKITAAGAVTFTGVLADGVAISGGSALVDGNVWPLYAPTFLGKGGLAGHLHFAKITGASDAAGTLRWVRPAAQKDKFYPAGFTTAVAAVASSYQAPPVDYFTASLRLEGGGLTAPLVKTLSVNSTTFAFTSPGDSTIRVTLNAKTGVFTGSALDPATSRKVTLGGALFQANRSARGYFKGAAPATGALKITPQ